MSFHVRSARGIRGSILQAAVVSVVIVVPVIHRTAGAQATSGAVSIDSLAQQAVATSPRVRAATARVSAAEAMVRPAGLRPDPMLMMGIQNVPLLRPGFGDQMTMKMVGVSQTISRGGRLAAAARVAEADVAVAVEARRVASLQVRREIRTAAFDVAYADRALAVIGQNRSALADMISAAEVRFGTGTAGSAAGGMPGGGGRESGLADILRARVDAANLSSQASSLREQRRTAVATINALLSRPPDTPIEGVDIPPSIERAAVAATGDIRFESALIGSRVAGSPLPSVDSLQRLARDNNPDLRMRAAMVSAQASRADLASRQRKPDIEATLQYGQRDGLPDMITAMVSVPVQLRRRDREDQLSIAASAERSAAEADRLDAINRVNAEVARLHAAAERSRTQLALYKASVIPQSQLGVDAALTAFRAANGSLRAVLDARIAVFNAEVGYQQALADFARTVAELEEVVGMEVLHG